LLGAAPPGGQVRRPAAKVYARFDRVLAVVRETAGRSSVRDAASCRARLALMTLTMKAHVRGGRLVLDEPTDLPEGSEVELVLADEGDELDDDDRARLHASLQRSDEQLRAGRGIDADQALALLRG
jgi:hypothetical protein